MASSSSSSTSSDESSSHSSATISADTTTITLYSYWRSSCSYRVRIVLHFKGIGYTCVPVHLLKDGGQQLTSDYAKLNPMRELPTLLIDGQTITQSTAIVEYLEESRPHLPSMLPSLGAGGGGGGAAKRAKVREICNIIANDIQPVQNLRILKQIAGFFTDPAEKEAQRNAWAVRCMTAGFVAIEALLETCAGTYCVGEEVTLADAFLAPQVYNAERFKVDMTPFPIITRVYNEAATLDAFKKAHPSAQPDAE